MDLTTSQALILDRIREDDFRLIRHPEASPDDLVRVGYLERDEGDHYRRTALGTTALARYRTEQKLGSHADPDHLLREVLAFLGRSPDEPGWERGRYRLCQDIRKLLERR